MHITAQARVIVHISINSVMCSKHPRLLLIVFLGTQRQSSLADLSGLPSLREFHRRVLFSGIWEKLLSTEAVETGIVKPIEAII